MQPIMRLAIALFAFAAAPSIAHAMRGHGGGVPGCEEAVTNVPWGTVDTSCVGGPPGANGWTGGIGGPGMRISEQGHRSWPNFPAAVCGRWVACNPYTTPPPPPR